MQRFVKIVRIQNIEDIKRNNKGEKIKMNNF